MSDQSGISLVWERFHRERTKPLFDRFPGYYCAVVVETNDSLQNYRVRFKCPELHDWSLEPKQCPWADKAPWLGGKNAGSWSHPIIGDLVWIIFEKQHPYGPIWVGFATPTRRKYYPLESIYTRSPLAVNADEESDGKPDDYLEEYLPKDFRPMSFGSRDRYGNATITSAVGFFPKEHDIEPAVVGQDAISKSDFERGKKPEVNNPDRKYNVKATKYGIYEILSDVGYYWKNDGDTGEFEGDFDNDHDFEIERTKYFVKLLNENEPNSANRDQRRYEIRTRAGHKFEMRDVGYAQQGGARSGCEEVSNAKSRPEYGKARILSKWNQTDERWVKFRSKGGHLIQLMDMGFHPEEDNFYKRQLIEEIGPDADDEKTGNWTGRDSRQIRFVSRWGSKFVLDDRGTDPKEAETKEKPRGNGWFLKTRRSWTTEPSTPRGFAFEAIDKDELNTTRWYTPKSKIIEMNDRKDYMMFCTDTSSEISREWKKLLENEFALKIAMTDNPELNTYHLKLDKANGYVRLKTAVGGDNKLRPEPEQFPDADPTGGINQGIEARDGRVGVDGAWVETVDVSERGIWFSEKNKLGIWRSRTGKDQFIMIMDQDGAEKIVIRNNENGPIQIYCKGDIEIVSERNIALKAGDRITLKAENEIAFDAGGGQAKLNPGGWYMNVNDNAPAHTGFLPLAFPGGGAQNDTGAAATVIDPTPIDQEKRVPVDRGVVGNGPFNEVPEKVVKVCE